MIYTDFVEAMRKGQVVQGMGTRPPIPLETFYRKQDWALTSFDFGQSMWTLANNLSLSKAIREWVMAGRLHLPHPDCVFIMEYPETSVLTRLMEQDDDTMVIQPYSRPKTGNRPFARLNYAILIDEQNPYRVVGGHLAVDCSLDEQPGAVDDPEQAERWRTVILSGIIRAAFLLASPKPEDEVLKLTTPVDPKLDGVNRGRIGAGLKPLPATRTLTIHTEAMDKVVWSRSGSHSPKRSHLRRGHERRYKDGKVIWVKAHPVKGGAAAVETRVHVAV